MKAWRQLMFVTCAWTALLVIPQAVTAKSGYYIFKPSHFEMAHLKGSNGYAIDLISFDAKHLVLAASRFTGVGSQSVSYSVPRSPRRDELHASLGRFGHISLHFRPSGPTKVQPEPDKCRGRDSTEQKGRFVGSIRFRGEHGFTSVHASSASGQVLHRFKKVCRRMHKPSYGGIEQKFVSLGASVKGAPDRASFGAYDLKSTSSPGAESVTGSASYTASTTERRGRMTVTHSASAFAESSTFAVSNPSAGPIAASVAPPFPFAGTATLEHGQGGASKWSGDLSVNLAGVGTVPLTGPSFTARLCRVGLSCLCPLGRPCAIVVGTSGRVAATSGSQPWAFGDTRPLLVEVEP
jgi:hypothetical protein